MFLVIRGLLYASFMTLSHKYFLQARDYLELNFNTATHAGRINS